MLGLWLCTSYRRNPPTALVYDPPVGFTGACQAGEGFEPSHCNNKIVGARFYLDGFLARHELDPGEFRSPKDVDGHGTHIATIIAGNSVDATLLGTRVGRVSGIAPRARIAVYKACWLKPGDLRGTCTTSDLVRAIDDAVADGVDLINYSVGSLETELDAPDDLALLDALDAGVLTVVAAGNDGPELDTIGSPKQRAVGADDGRVDAGRRVLRRRDRDHGAGRSRRGDRDARGVVHAAAHARGPDRGAARRRRRRRRDAQRHRRQAASATRASRSTNSAEMDGRIALIERGGCEFQVKIAQCRGRGRHRRRRLQQLGGPPIVMNGDTGSVGIPAVMIGNDDGQVLVDRLAADAEDDDFDDRGRDSSPCALARGIFASVPGEPQRRRRLLVARPVALRRELREARRHGARRRHPGRPNARTSRTGCAARRTSTCRARRNRRPRSRASRRCSRKRTRLGRRRAEVRVDDDDLRRGGSAADGEPADAFDMGAGHIDANRAVDPGLVYDSSFADYAAYLCGLPEPPFAAGRLRGARRGRPSERRPSI